MQSFLTFETVLTNELSVPSLATCIFRYISNSFYDTNSICFLSTIWLVIACERKMLANCFSFLMAHLKKRYLFLFTFCLLNLSLAIYDAFMESDITHDYCQSKNLSIFYLFTFRTVALSFWTFGLSTILWQFFGGSLDPNKQELSVNDFNFLKFLKITSIIEACNVLIEHIWFVVTMLSSNHDLIFKLMSNLCFLASLVTFLFLEKFSFKDMFNGSKNNEITTSISNNGNDNNNNQKNYDEENNITISDSNNIDNNFLICNNNSDLQ